MSKDLTVKKRVLRFLALVLLATPAIQVYSPPALAVSTYYDCVSNALRQMAGLEPVRKPFQQLPANFGPEEQESLLRQFQEDGRPILFITDGSEKQKSGVVTVMKVLPRITDRLTDGKVDLKMVTADQFPHVYIKSMQDVVLSYMSQGKFEQILKETNPQAIHIATEGPLGKAAARYLRKHNIPYTSAYHTDWPQYFDGMAAKAVKSAGQWLPRGAQGAVDRAAAAAGRAVNKFTQRDLRSFHDKSGGVMVPTESMAKQLIDRGQDPSQILYWSHGVETDLFRPELRDPKVYEGLQRPISVFIGRVSLEKNLDDFLKMKVPGTKVIVGDGPELQSLKAKYPDVVFLGRKNYEDLPKYYASADVFVFPSLTDTFGLVQLEALATGTPVVAYKVQGPKDVIRSDKVGALAAYDPSRPDANVDRLTDAWKKAVRLNREDARKYAEENTWERSTVEFLYFLHRLPKGLFTGERPKPLPAPAPAVTAPVGLPVPANQN